MFTCLSNMEDNVLNRNRAYDIWSSKSPMREHKQVPHERTQGMSLKIWKVKQTNEQIDYKLQIFFD